MNPQVSRQSLPKIGLLLLLISLSFNACKTSKKGTETTETDKELNKRVLLASIEQTRFQPDWLNAKAKINYEDADISIGGSATIRLKKDSLMWISIRKLGFEVARALATPDSVYILDRLNNEYAIYGLKELEASYSLPGDFRLLQSIFLGSPYFLDPRGIELEADKDQLLLKDEAGPHSITYSLNPKDFRMQGLDYQALDSDRTLKLDLEEFDKIEGKQVFSYFRNLRMASSETGNVGMTIKFSQIELNVPREMSFRIPPRYSKMDE